MLRQTITTHYRNQKQVLYYRNQKTNTKSDTQKWNSSPYLLANSCNICQKSDTIVEKVLHAISCTQISKMCTKCLSQFIAQMRTAIAQMSRVASTCICRRMMPDSTHPPVQFAAFCGQMRRFATYI